MFVGYIEAQIFSKFTGPTPKLYSQDIDDCINATLSPHEHPDSFLAFVQSFHPVLKFFCTISNTSIAFLDILVNIHNCTHTTYLLQMCQLTLMLQHLSPITTPSSPPRTPNSSVCAGSAATTVTETLHGYSLTTPPLPKHILWTMP